MRKVGYLLGILVLAMMPVTVMAQSISQINQEAKQYMSEGQSMEAYNLLKEQYYADEYNNTSLFLLGLAAKNLQKFEEAKNYFEEFLSKEQAPRVSLELAEVYHALGEQTKARNMFYQVKAMDIPKSVGDNIDRYLAAMDQRVGKNWNFRISTGYMYDTNVNTATDQNTVVVSTFPIALPLDANGQRQKDHAKISRFNFNHTKTLNDQWAWLTDFGFAWTDYNDKTALTNRSLSLSSGPAWRRGNTTYSFPLLVNYLKFEADSDESDYHSITRGFAPQIHHIWDEKWSGRFSLSYQNKNHHDDSPRDSDVGGVNGSIRYQINNSSYVETGLYLETGHAQRDEFSYELGRIYSSYYKVFNQHWSWYMSGSYTDANYQSTEALFTDRRADQTFYGSATLNFYMPELDSTLSFTYAHTNANNPVDLYEYDRDQYTLMLSKNF